MNLLGNRKFALLMAVILVVAGTLFGAHRSAASVGAEIETMFYEGVDGSGYGIAGDLSDRLDYAQYLCKIAGAFDGLDEEIASVQDARLHLDTADGHSAQFAANEALTEAVYALDAAMRAAGYESDDFTRYLSNFDSKGMTITHEAEKFNAQVRSYNTELLGAFPMNLLRTPAAIEELEAFA
jgi:hypothetical protein